MVSVVTVTHTKGEHMPRRPKDATKRKRMSNFIQRIRKLPENAKKVDQLPDGTIIYADEFGTVFATREETVTYVLLQGKLF